MNKSFPIGIFDSGIGGLSVLSKIQSQLPGESLIYVADSLNAPYGTKDNLIILRRAIIIVDFLIKHHQIKLLVIACNTATAAAIKELRSIYSIPIVGMEPAIKPANEASALKKVGILATEGTLKSSKFSALLDTYSGDTQFYTQPCVGLVELIEQGHLESKEIITLVHKNLMPLYEKNVDVIVLGCTHFIFIKNIVEDFFDKKVTVIETGSAVAIQVQRKLNEFSLENNGPNIQCIIYSNSPNENMDRIIHSILAANKFEYVFYSNWNEEQ